MAQMKKLNPRMQALKERYAEDKKKFSEALMRMYKEEKVNPLGGCLPILIQIPVFIALYWVARRKRRNETCSLCGVDSRPCVS